MNVDASLEQLLESLKTGFYFPEIQHLVEEEQQNHQHFHEMNTGHNNSVTSNSVSMRSQKGWLRKMINHRYAPTGG